MSSDNRPLSPHLTIYRPQITSVLSILHRITGMVLAAGTVVIVAWLYIIAYEVSYYNQLYSMLSSTIGRIFLIGWTVAFYYHLTNGIRHLFWDMGKGFSLPQTTRSGWAVLVATVVLTGVTWCSYLHEVMGL